MNVGDPVADFIFVTIYSQEYSKPARPRCYVMYNAKGWPTFSTNAANAVTVPGWARESFACALALRFVGAVSYDKLAWLAWSSRRGLRFGRSVHQNWGVRDCRSAGDSSCVVERALDDHVV